MTKTDAWMPLWIGAYLADTQHLARDEHGAYLLLLMAYWRAGCPLPDDDKRLSAVAKATPKEWKSLRPTMAEFFVVADGQWTHKRVEQELAGSLDRKQKAVDKAKAAADARWKHPAKDASGNAPSIPQALHKECPTPSPSLLRKEKEDSPRKREPALTAPEDVAEQVWKDWVQLRKAKRATVSETAVAEARTEAQKAGMTLERFLSVWCIRGSQGLQADWIKPHERAAGTGETAFQKTSRERMQQWAPGVAAKTPGANNVIELEALDVTPRRLG